jgi:hypothetical protein
MIWSYILTIIFLENLCNIDVPNTTIAVSILCNSITHAHKYVIVVLYVPVATHRHLPSKGIIL